MAYWETVKKSSFPRTKPCSVTTAINPNKATLVHVYHVVLDEVLKEIGHGPYVVMSKYAIVIDP